LQVKFKVLLQPYWAQGSPSRFDLRMEVNSTNPEIVVSDKNNLREIKIPIQVDTGLIIEG
jgi:hypothetical protein